MPDVISHKQTMKGVVLPGDATAKVIEKPVPQPNQGQVLIKVKASGICGSDLRAIYFGHHSYVVDGVFAGHEPCGQIVSVGPGVERLKEGDRVSLYHIIGCGDCTDCRSGYMISCKTASQKFAYGWQIDGGHAEYIIAEESTCILMPDEVSYVDGALVACGFGTAYEALCRANLSTTDSVLITGLGPVGLSAGLLAKKMGATLVVGTDISKDRQRLAVEIGAADEAYSPDGLADDRQFDVTIDCSGNALARQQALLHTADRGRCVMVGEGGSMAIENVSEEVIHKGVTIIGSWVTSTWRMQELLNNLVEWDLRPDILVGPDNRFSLDEAGLAYELAAGRNSGKICFVME